MYHVGSDPFEETISHIKNTPLVAMSDFNSSRGDPQVGGENSPSSINDNSSSQETASHGLGTPKEKRKPTITPRKFNRFFTPRSHEHIAIKLPRGALGDITAPANNRNGTQSSPLQPSSYVNAAENSQTIFTRETKRRKLLHPPSPSPDDSTSKKQSPFDQRRALDDNLLDDHNHLSSSQHSAAVGNIRRGHRKLSFTPFSTLSKQIRQFETRGLAGQLLQLSLKSGAASRGQPFIYPKTG